MMSYITEQEEFWAGDFGIEYIDRNNSEQLLYSKVALWAQMLRAANDVKSMREFGCNIGLNLVALKRINPSLELSGYEINKAAAKQAGSFGVAKITNDSILNKIDDDPVNLTFTVSVLIHINPEFLTRVYDNLVNGTNRYVLIAEYYNPSPINIIYRGHED